MSGGVSQAAERPAPPAPRPVRIVPPDPRWPEEFDLAAQRLRGIAGPAASRIDHIGSTSVPGLQAKDFIDVQVSVPDIGAAAPLVQRLRDRGFRQGLVFQHDLFHPLGPEHPELRKLYMREPEGERRVNIHIRQHGFFNQRYALLFRDYLRASAPARDAYGRFKELAAALFPDDMAGYLRLKDPFFHMVYEAAQLWAQAQRWDAHPAVEGPGTR